jgi:hypothetical protein
LHVYKFTDKNTKKEKLFVNGKFDKEFTEIDFVSRYYIGYEYIGKELKSDSLIKFGNKIIDDTYFITTDKSGNSIVNSLTGRKFTIPSSHIKGYKQRNGDQVDVTIYKVLFSENTEDYCYITKIQAYGRSFTTGSRYLVGEPDYKVYLNGRLIHFPDLSDEHIIKLAMDFRFDQSGKLHWYYFATSWRGYRSYFNFDGKVIYSFGHYYGPGGTDGYVQDFYSAVSDDFSRYMIFMQISNSQGTERNFKKGSHWYLITEKSTKPAYWSNDPQGIINTYDLRIVGLKNGVLYNNPWSDKAEINNIQTNENRTLFSCIVTRAKQSFYIINGVEQDVVQQGTLGPIYMADNDTLWYYNDKSGVKSNIKEFKSPPKNIIKFSTLNGKWYFLSDVGNGIKVTTSKDSYVIGLNQKDYSFSVNGNNILFSTIKNGKLIFGRRKIFSKDELL